MAKKPSKPETTVILTHEHTDFDGLASLLAAHKLYPKATPVLPQHPNRNLRAFLSLYWDELDFKHREDLGRIKIGDAILVDTQAASPIKGMGEWTQMHIIDHHPLTIELDEGWTYHGEPLGATTTLLLEDIRERGIPLSPVEATLLLLGIHEDTGSLTYSTTTPRDVYAAGWLLEQGAILNVLHTYLHQPLSEGQMEIYRRLMQTSELQQVQGYSVLIAALELDTYVEELSTLAHKVNDVLDPDASLMLFAYKRDVQLIGRSSVEAIDVGEIARHFGGGGHSKAAAAVIQDMALDEARERLERLLKRLIKPPRTVRDIMSYGVRTVHPQMTIWDAELEARKYGHEGFPVLEDGKLVGVITRREIESALYHKLAQASVGEFMRKGDIHVAPGDPVEHVPEVMMRFDVGQVPVVEGGSVLGIVTRTDLVKLMVSPVQQTDRQRIAEMMEETIPAPRRELILEARDAANELGYSLFIVGGFVRDLLLGIPDLDVDLVVEGDAIQVAHELAHRIGARVRAHQRFGTAKVLLKEPRDPDLPEFLDLATTRVEFYERDRPTLPRVEHSSIKADLKRRDFTINTLAICLDRNRYGELLDPYGGVQDLQDGWIRVLHNFSFIEDPTRILRAVRLEQRLDFHIEPQTLERIQVDVEQLKNVTGPRIRNELDSILAEKEPENSWQRLDQLGALSPIHPALVYTRWIRRKSAELRRLWQEWSQGDGLFEVKEGPEQEALPGIPPLLYWCLVTYEMDEEDIEAVVERLRITRKDAEVIMQVNQLSKALPELAREDILPSKIYHLLESYSQLVLLAAYVATDEPVARAKIRKYQTDLRHVTPHIDGNDIKMLGLPPGPQYKRILTRIHDAVLNGEVQTMEEEAALAQELVRTAL